MSSGIVAHTHHRFFGRSTFTSSTSGCLFANSSAPFVNPVGDTTIKPLTLSKFFKSWYFENSAPKSRMPTLVDRSLTSTILLSLRNKLRRSAMWSICLLPTLTLELTFQPTHHLDRRPNFANSLKCPTSFCERKKQTRSWYSLAKTLIRFCGSNISLLWLSLRVVVDDIILLYNSPKQVYVYVICSMFLYNLFLSPSSSTYALINNPSL